MPDLETRILQVVRERDGQLDWKGLASIVVPESLSAFQRAIGRLHRAKSIQLEFDDQGLVRLWTVTS